MYKIVSTSQADKDALLLERMNLKPKAVALLRITRENPFQNPPPYEKLQGCERTYSRRINIQHRLVYEVYPNADGERDEDGQLYQGIIKIIRMWTHYD